MDKDLPWPFAVPTVAGGVLVGNGALCSPALDDALTTLRDSVGLWPRGGRVPRLFATESAGDTVGFRPNEPFLLCGVAGA